MTSSPWSVGQEQEQPAIQGMDALAVLYPFVRERLSAWLGSMARQSDEIDGNGALRDWPARLESNQ